MDPGPGEGPGAGRDSVRGGRRAARWLRGAEAAQPPDALSDGWMGAEEVASTTCDGADRVQVCHGRRHGLWSRLTTATEDPASLRLQLAVHGVQPLERAGEALGVLGQLGSGAVSAIFPRPGYRIGFRPIDEVQRGHGGSRPATQLTHDALHPR